jgi:RNA polymerase sigma-70 factor (ECF subfamily)
VELLGDVESDPERDSPGSGLGEDPRDLLPGDEDIVRMLDGRLETESGDRLGDPLSRDRRERGEAGHRHPRAQTQREEQALSCSSFPPASAASATGGLFLGHGEDTLGCVRRKQVLGRGAALGKQVERAAEAPFEPRPHRFRRERYRHDLYTSAAVKPRLTARRRISSPLRADPLIRYGRLSDPILIKRAKDGDRKALDAICERYAPRVERIARRELSDLRDAQDAAQESLLKLCQRIDQYRGEAQFATWLHRLVVNTCHDTSARERLRKALPLPEELDLEWSLDGDPVVETLRGELCSDLSRHLSELSPEQARVVVLKDVLGFSFEQIADAASMPVGTAKCYAHRARKRLRQKLEQEAAA